MAGTPQQRSDEPGEGLGTTPAAPQSRTDQEQDRQEEQRPARETDDPQELQSPVTREEVEQRQLDDDVDTAD